MKAGIYIVFITLLLFIFNSCEKQKDAPVAVTTGCTITNVTFKNTIQAIINNDCAYSVSCHASGTVYPDFSTYEGVKEFVDNGQFYEQLFVTYRMPPQPQPLLDICQLTQIKVWINTGAPQ